MGLCSSVVTFAVYWYLFALKTCTVSHGRRQRRSHAGVRVCVGVFVLWNAASIFFFYHFFSVSGVLLSGKYFILEAQKQTAKN